MKINKQSFLKILADHLVKKLKVNTYMESTDLLIQGLNTVFLSYFPLMESKGIVYNNTIDVSKLKEETTKFFTLVPVLNIPFGNMGIQITREDCSNFIADLERFADVEEIICLPCSK